jgi:hypothetical protein
LMDSAPYWFLAATFGKLSLGCVERWNHRDSLTVTLP